jgi:ribonucleoside-triphosphate reductase
MLTDTTIDSIVCNVERFCSEATHTLSVEEIQDIVETELMQVKAFSLAKNYITYRYLHTLNRKSNTTDKQILSLIDGVNEEIKQENSNKNPMIASVQRDYIAGEVSKDISRRFLMPEDIMKAHDAGVIHCHDLDYFLQKIYNCCLVNLDDMLQNGTVISGTKIDKPKSFLTACTITTQIIAQVASSQYGGQSITLTHLAPFVDISRKKIRRELQEELSEMQLSDSQISSIVEKRLRREIAAGVQTIQYQVVTLMTTNGQAPFITVFMYLGEARNSQEKKDLSIIIEEVLKQRYTGVKNEQGVYITPAFPKLVYVLEEQNVHPTAEYYYLTQLAAKCTAKRMVPDYISEKIMKLNKIDSKGIGRCYPCMGCRSVLTPYVDCNDNPKYYGRFNQGVVTLNLPDVALSSGCDLDKFWELLEERAELCHRALKIRHERLEGTTSDIAPILWQHGAIARLEKGEKIDSLLHNGYSTISLGYAGLWECVYALIGKKLTEKEGENLCIDILKRLNSFTAKWKSEEHIDYSLYGTPLESTTYKFAKSLQNRFGVIKGVSDKNYITNSYHVHVTEPIDVFSKLALESKFQVLSPGGVVSYFEAPHLEDNLEAVLQIIRYMYDTIMYAEMNIKSDYCQECGFDGEILITKSEDGKLIWRCPHCGNTDERKLHVARRTCGYIGSQFWNQGRTQEIQDRVLHI